MQVEIWSDVVCPWCYIGKRRFESALTHFEAETGEKVDLVWRSFQLDPTTPKDAKQSVTEMLSEKYRVSAAEAKAMNDNVTTLAAAEGLDYHLDLARASNTFDAHRLIHYAAEHGKQDEMQERIMQAYFTEGRHVGEIDTLVELAVEIGLNADNLRRVLEGDVYSANVRADIQRAAAIGVRGVPFFVFAEKYGVSGAQRMDVFLQALEQTWNEIRVQQPTLISATSADADGCTDDSCAV
ncbi:MAG: DsbA family oxidoreductase [Burkholderiales bacterium]|nr:DsbA family oxidoreductase [Anaerolineae bacterium]